MKKLITVADILDYIRSHRIKYKHPFTTGFNTGLDAIESFITGEPVLDNPLEVRDRIEPVKDCPRCNGTMIYRGFRWVCMNCDHHEKEK